MLEVKIDGIIQIFPMWLKFFNEFLNVVVLVLNLTVDGISVFVNLIFQFFRVSNRGGLVGEILTDIQPPPF